MPPNLALLSTLIGSNYPCLELIFMGPKVFEPLKFDCIYFRFGSKLCGQIDGISMGTYCALLVADLFLFCYERDFILSVSEDTLSDVIEAINFTSGIWMSY